MHAVSPEVLCASKSPPMLCEGLVPSTGILLLAGAPGVGKTFYSLECALGLTAGVSAFGQFKAKPSRVLYVGEDSPGWDVGSILRKLLRGHGIEPGECEGFSLAVHQGANLNEHKGMLELWELIDRYMNEWHQDNETQELVEVGQRGLVIIDNLRKVHNKKESNSDDMVLIMDRLRVLAETVCVMVLHHPSKPSEFEKENWAEIRGSGEIVGGSDAVVFLKQRKGLVHANVIRARAAKPLDFSYSVEDEGDEIRLRVCEVDDPLESEFQTLLENKSLVARSDIAEVIVEGGFKGSKEALTKAVTRRLEVLISKGVMRKIGHNQYKSLRYREIA